MNKIKAKVLVIGTY